MELEILASLPAVSYRAASNTEAWGFTSVQGGLLDHLGVEAHELCRDPGRWVLMVHRDDRERVITERRRAARSGFLDIEYRMIPEDGDERWVHDIAIRDDVRGDMCGVVTDLTEHHRVADVLEELHEARRAAVRRLLRAVAVRDTTVQLFLHDMRSPLTAVAGLARTLRDRGGQLSPSDRERVLDRVIAASDQVIALVDDVAQFWELPLDDGALATQPIRLASLVSDVVQEVAADDRTVDVDVHDLVVESNATLLRRVLVGVVRNATVHTPEGTAIRISALDGHGRTVVEVEDDGPGIPDEVRDGLFDPFVSRSHAGPGLGIGLTLAHAAVELLGGEISACEGARGGTAIRIVLPHAVDMASSGVAVA